MSSTDLDLWAVKGRGDSGGAEKAEGWWRAGQAQSPAAHRPGVAEWVAMQGSPPRAAGRSVGVARECEGGWKVAAAGSGRAARRVVGTCLRPMGQVEGQHKAASSDGSNP